MLVPIVSVQGVLHWDNPEDFQGPMANVLKREKQEQVITALVEGSSIRSTERMTGVHRESAEAS